MSQFPFILVPQGQRKATSEVKRSIRSHAAIVSRPDPATTKRAKPRLHKAEQIISFDDKASIATNVSEDDKAHSTRTASASTLVPTDSESNLAQSTFRSSLACDVLSGEIFSPVSQLATFRKPYLPGILNHYFHHLVIPAALNSTGVSAPTFQETWFPIVVVDPLIFEVVVLFAATHFATYSNAANLEQLSRELLFLKQSALAALIRRVQLEKRRSLTGVMSPYADYSFHGCSDILIAASVKLASYEAIFGSVDAVSLIPRPDLVLTELILVVPHSYVRCCTTTPSTGRPEHTRHERFPGSNACFCGHQLSSLIRK